MKRVTICVLSAIQAINSEIFISDNKNHPSIEYDDFGSGDNTNFGFSLAMTNSKTILIGAPRDNELISPQVNKANNCLGEVYSCAFSASNSKLSCGRMKNSMNNQLTHNLAPGSQSQAVTKRLYGMNIEYDSTNDALLTCAPGSFMPQEVQRSSMGVCEMINNYSRSSNNKYNIFLQPNQDEYYKTDDWLDEQAKKKYPSNGNFHNRQFAYQTEIIKTKTKGTSYLLSTAPLAGDERGSIQFQKLSATNRRDIDVNEVKNINKHVPPANRKGISMTTFSCLSKRMVAVGNSSPKGEILIYTLKGSTEKSVESSRGEFVATKPEFGASFGFQQVIVNINNKDYVLVSSPFSTFGRLDLYEACSRRNVNHLLSDEIPKEIVRFGYSLENIGNVDTIEGEEILVGAPAKKDGSVTVLSVRNGKIEFIQTIATGESLALFS